MQEFLITSLRTDCSGGSMGIFRYNTTSTPLLFILCLIPLLSWDIKSFFIVNLQPSWQSLENCKASCLLVCQHLNSEFCSDWNSLYAGQIEPNKRVSYSNIFTPFILKVYCFSGIKRGLPVQVRCTILDAWGWCTGMTQRDGMGREEGGGFRMGNTCIPVADSFRYLAKLIQYLKV